MRGSTAIILYADLDAFHAPVEQLRDPRLRGQPIAAGGKGTGLARVRVWRDDWSSGR